MERCDAAGLLNERPPLTEIGRRQGDVGGTALLGASGEGDDAVATRVGFDAQIRWRVGDLEEDGGFFGWTPLFRILRGIDLCKGGKRSGQLSSSEITKVDEVTTHLSRPWWFGTTEGSGPKARQGGKLYPLRTNRRSLVAASCPRCA